MEIQQVNEQVFPQLYRVTLYAEILSLLGAGRDGGTQVREICMVTGKGNRAVRKAIEEIRRLGVVICTDCLHGYYYPDTLDELRRYIRQEERRGSSTFQILDSARKLLQEQEEQG